MGIATVRAIQFSIFLWFHGAFAPSPCAGEGKDGEKEATCAACPMLHPTRIVVEKCVLKKYPEVCGTYFPGENTRLPPMAASLTLSLHAVPERDAYPLSPVLQTLSIPVHINRTTFFLFLEKFV